MKAVDTKICWYNLIVFDHSIIQIYLLSRKTWNEVTTTISTIHKSSSICLVKLTVSMTYPTYSR